MVRREMGATTYGVTVLLGNFDDLAEFNLLLSWDRRTRLGELVEDVTERSTQYSFNLGDLVPSIDQILQRRDNRQSSSDRRFEIDQSRIDDLLRRENVVP